MSWLLEVWALTTALAAALSQYSTNGQSKWGTLPSPNLPKFLDNCSLVDDTPWGDTVPGGEPPNTGVIRYYDFSITRAYKSPDGFNKSVILINDQFPGPLIEANWGDMIQVTVTNNIDSEDEGTTLHWHGLSQKKSPWYDGVPGYTQCPIAPGSTFTYTFQADQFGSSWYHSHYSAQYNDGLYGPMIIYGPVQPSVDYDFDLGPVMISDYYHDNYYDTLVQGFKKPPIIVPLDNNLINGKGFYDCNQTASGDCLPGAGLSKFQIESGKKYRLRFINTGSLANQKVSLDNHEMTIIANDFVPVEPYTTNVVTLGAGQRTDVIVEATGSATDAVWLRAEIDMLCLNESTTYDTALAAVYYQSANTSSVPQTTGTSWESNHCRNDPLEDTVPYYPIAPPATPSTVDTVNITLGYNATGYILFFVDGSSFRADYNEPVLFLANQNVSQVYPTERNVYDFGNNTSVRMILTNTFAMQHPMHLHGHNFWVLAEGTGTWNGTITNPSNPQRRDTQILQAGSTDEPSYLVLEWELDNPGVWPLHCHMSNHASAGLVLSILEQPDSIATEMNIPAVMQQTCVDWDKFSHTNYVDQIDSGV
ncbi:extracellular dihydrogeodin oxidase/laccase-like protein [Aspergillus heteromorphus CBS 117.55]|uniref:Extracellular dihydrogeodin oxidase/laccase-like protein n=1 Tax=Aspergillus heteromorphus CBS 117.55 TaxID=1448321 RepID=A0A317WPM5_9EURO|nr:extracellular dihydrogeodin oxidase/laccase-like protein [Aspergillus heteromorphus CBS 117.55]PWY88379.1 extracellular dihydrogeodin oxidase/laccase-like protein [Aspergillus heteromorphus CBS 117.55]